MPASASSNRTMFWRIIRRLVSANRGRLVVILLALGAGAAVTAALLNLQIDAQRRLTTEFRVLGANIVIAPRDAQDASGSSQVSTLDQGVLWQIPRDVEQRRVSMIAVLYLIADAYESGSSGHRQVVVAGELGDHVRATLWQRPQHSAIDSHEALECTAGVRVAAQMRLQADSYLTLRNQGREETCGVALMPGTGGPEDDQVSLPLQAAQKLAALPGRVSLIQIIAPGRPQEITNYLASLQQSLPDADVRPIRQFTEGEAKIYSRISGVLTATVGLVLVLTALCVMAAMTNVAMERRNDVGLMKAIGGATRRVLRLFLAEAALLGLASGILGAAVGILLSMWLGKAVFGLAARPRLIVYPVAVALTMIVAIAGAYPLRRLANIRPASIFRGEA